MPGEPSEKEYTLIPRYKGNNESGRVAAAMLLVVVVVVVVVVASKFVLPAPDRGDAMIGERFLGLLVPCPPRCIILHIANLQSCVGREP